MWVFNFTTNQEMHQFVGKSVDVATPHRKDDGHKVAFVYEPGNMKNWYFYTSTIETINRVEYPEKGYATLEVRTRNSVYRFYKKIQ